MVTRAASGPRPIGALVGTYVYGEDKRSPRQLTSVTSNGGTTKFAYDRAGRVVETGETTLVYDAFDGLLQALTKTGKAIATHDYGYDGLRTYTHNADGTEQIWLSRDVTEKDGRREHTIDVEGRTIAKAWTALSKLPAPDAAPIAPPILSMTTTGAPTAPFSYGALAGTLVVVGWLLARVRRVAPALQWKTPLRAAYALGALVCVVVACSPSAGSHEDAAGGALAWTTTSRTYFHQGFAAGPVLFTRGDGTVEEERLYEPFGVPLEAQQDGRSGVGDVDFRLESRNELNAESDFNTGFSYHGARWMAPIVARWLTPDPPTRAPDPKFLIAPWDLNPYSFVRSNPLVYWDPDGRDKKSLAEGFFEGAAKAAVWAAVAVVAVALVPEIAEVAVAVGPEVTTGLAVAKVAVAAVDAYQNRHELVAMGQRVVAHTTTDADDRAIGQMAGGAVVRLTLGVAARGSPAATPVTPKPGPGAAPKAPAQPRPSSRGGVSSSAGGSSASPAKGGLRVTGDALKAARRDFEAVKPDRWKYEAATNVERYTSEQIADMAKGRAPMGADGYRMELHHETPLAEGGSNAFENLKPMTRTDHRLGPNYKANHPNLP
jgi:RHS repeat-associated protein